MTKKQIIGSIATLVILTVALFSYGYYTVTQPHPLKNAITPSWKPTKDSITYTFRNRSPECNRQDKNIPTQVDQWIGTDNSRISLFTCLGENGNHLIVGYTPPHASQVEIIKVDSYGFGLNEERCIDFDADDYPVSFTLCALPKEEEIKITKITFISQNAQA